MMQLAPTLRSSVYNASHLDKDNVNTPKAMRELLNERNYFYTS